MANGTDYGAFVPTTNIWDVTAVYGVDVTSPEFKELIVRLYQNINLIANVLNIKDSGYYDTDPFINGQLFFPNPALNSSSSSTPIFRPVTRLVIPCGTLPNTATINIPHNLSPNTAWSATRIYGAATDPVGLNYIPLPYSSPVLANNIEVNIDALNVNITTGSNRTAFTISYVIFEYITS